MYAYIYLAIVTCMFNVMKIKKVKKKCKKERKKDSATSTLTATINQSLLIKISNQREFSNQKTTTQ